MSAGFTLIPIEAQSHRDHVSVFSALSTSSTNWHKPAAGVAPSVRKSMVKSDRQESERDTLIP
jgi:hypothetical protein